MEQDARLLTFMSRMMDAYERRQSHRDAETDHADIKDNGAGERHGGQFHSTEATHHNSVHDLHHLLSDERQYHRRCDTKILYVVFLLNHDFSQQSTDLVHISIY